MQLSILIVNYNVCYFLEQCLWTIQQAASGISHEIIVVDNASSDDSRQYLPSKFPGVRFIWNEDNKGFGRANNQALAIASGAYLLLLNPDTLLPKQMLRNCLAFFETHPEAGAVGVRMYDGSGSYLPESKRGLPTPWTALYKLSGIIRWFPRHPVLARYYLGHLSPDEIQKVEVLAGAFMLIPKQVYQEVGGFDEAFFMYGEDIDLSYRIHLAGYTNYYLPEPGIIHFKGESTRRDLKNTVHFYEAMQLFVRKYYRRQSLLWRLLLEMAIILRGTLSAVHKWNRPGKAESARTLPWELIGAEASKKEITFSRTEKEQHATGQMVSVYALGEGFGIGEVLDLWKKRKPVGLIRFHTPGAAAIIGSDSSRQSGESLLLSSISTE